MTLAGIWKKCGSLFHIQADVCQPQATAAQLVDGIRVMCWGESTFGRLQLSLSVCNDTMHS